MTQIHLILFRYSAMTSCWKQYVLIRRTCSGPFSRAPMRKGALKHVAKCIALAVWSLSSVHSMHHVFIEWVFLSALWMFLTSSASIMPSLGGGYLTNYVLICYSSSENDDYNRPTLRQAVADMLLTYQRQAWFWLFTQWLNLFHIIYYLLCKDHRVCAWKISEPDIANIVSEC